MSDRHSNADRSDRRTDAAELGLSHDKTGAGETPRAHIGPNAIIRMAEALVGDIGEAQTRRLFVKAGLARYLSAPPQHMVDEGEVIVLHRLVRSELGFGCAARVSREAGRLTGDYLLECRIPKPVQWLLRVLPRRFAAQILLTAIGRNAWTFAGSGVFSAEFRERVRITIANCPLCRHAHAAAPLCGYYAATFERLFRALVDSRTTVVETNCAAAGDAVCSFEIYWRDPTSIAHAGPTLAVDD